MHRYKIFSLTFLITSLIVLSVLFMNSRLYLNKYIFQPLDQYQIEYSVVTDIHKLKDNLKLSLGVKEIWYAKDFVHLSQLLHSGVSRYMQNNQSYLYLYSKSKKLNKKEFKKLKSIVKNISLEGAYFLNPKFLDKVMINFKYIDDKDNEILFQYFEFIIEQEIFKNTKKNEINFTLSKELLDEIRDINQFLQFYSNNIAIIRDKITKYKETEVVRNIVFNKIDKSNYSEILNILSKINNEIFKEIELDKKNLSNEDFHNLEKWIKKKSTDLVHESIKPIINKYDFLNNLQDIINLVIFFEKYKKIEREMQKIENLDLLKLVNIQNGINEIMYGSKIEPVYGFFINKENIENLVKDINSVQKILEQSNSSIVRTLPENVFQKYSFRDLSKLIDNKLKLNEFIQVITDINFKKKSLNRNLNSIDFKKLTKTYLSNIKFVKKSVNTIEIFSSLLFSFVMSIIFTYLILNFGYKKNL